MLSYLQEFILFLVIAGIIIPIFRYFKINSILGYLIAGIVIGPYGLGALISDYPWLKSFVITDVKSIHRLGELGVIFLLFMIGLELSPDRLWKMRRFIFGLGTLQVIVTAFVIGIIAGFFGNSLEVSIILGTCLALSSTAIVMQWLSEKKKLGTPLGHFSFSILLMQDLMIIPILFFLSVFNQQNGQDILFVLLTTLLKAILAVVIIGILGHYAFKPIFRFVGSFRSAEIFIALTILIIIGLGIIAQFAGMTMAMGAFLAGLLLAETEYRHEIESYIDPFKGLLLGLFFISVGMGINYHILIQDPFWIIVSVLGLFLIKTVITGSLTLAFGAFPRIAAETGVLLGQGGEFGFLVIGVTVSLGLMPMEVAQFMLIVIGLTMLMTAPFIYITQKITRWIEPHLQFAKTTHKFAASQLSDHIIIAGYGRVGQMLSTILDQESIPYIILELDTHIVHRFRQAGKPIFYGNIVHSKVLESIGIEQAASLVLTIDDTNLAEKVIHIVKVHWPGISILARVQDIPQALKLHKMGDNITAIPENLEVSLEMATRLLDQMGVSPQTIKAYIEEKRYFEEGT